MRPALGQFLAPALLALLASLAAGCGGGGDASIAPRDGGGGERSCERPMDSASRMVEGETRHGCPHAATGGIIYSRRFADAGNPITEDLRLRPLMSGAPHIFRGTLVIGEAHRDCHAAGSECGAGGSIQKGGDGPTLTIEAGTVLAFESSNQFLLVNRGAQIHAMGTAEKPITFTSLSDVLDEAQPEAVQQWGGVVINGFGVTNKCAYMPGVRSIPSDRTADLAETGDLTVDGGCNVESEGSGGDSSSWYGGDNDADNSGRLEYVVIKHTGAEAVPDNELNGITFAAVGRGTVVNNLQVYSTYDDGVELFGGAVNISKLVAVYVRDDSIDIDEGYVGQITDALVIQQREDGNRCLEADGIGSFDSKPAQVPGLKAANLNSQPVISQLTCIVSPTGEPPGTHDPGAGLLLREGIEATIANSLVIATFDAIDKASEHYCISYEDHVSGDRPSFDKNVFACETRTGGMSYAGGATVEAELEKENQFAKTSIKAGGATDPVSDTIDMGLQLLAGTPPIYSLPFAQMRVDKAAPTKSPGAGMHLGALVQGGDDWLRPGGKVWVYGVFDGARAQPLWFE